MDSRKWIETCVETSRFFGLVQDDRKQFIKILVKIRGYTIAFRKEAKDQIDQLLDEASVNVLLAVRRHLDLIQ